MNTETDKKFEKEILTMHDISKYCHVHIATVTNWIDDGSLKAYKAKGRHRRVKRADLADFLQKYNIPLTLKQKILVIDYDESIRDGLKDILELKGYEVDTAEDGFTGAMLVEKYKPAVVILDHIMPAF